MRCCPGTAAAPQAASGHLCVHVVSPAGETDGQIIVTDPTDPDAQTPLGTEYNVGTAIHGTLGDGTVHHSGSAFSTQKQEMTTTLNSEDPGQ